MSSRRMSHARSKQSASRSESTTGTSLYAHLYRSIPACRQPGCSISRIPARVGRTPSSPSLRSRASGAKNRNASKCVHRIREPSTTASVPSAPSRSGSWECRTPCTSERYAIAHSCNPKQPRRGARAAVRASSSRVNATPDARSASTAATSTSQPPTGWPSTTAPATSPASTRR